jgi:hypothetical protein
MKDDLSFLSDGSGLMRILVLGFPFAPADQIEAWRLRPDLGIAQSPGVFHQQEQQPARKDILSSLRSMRVASQRRASKPRRRSSR